MIFLKKIHCKYTENSFLALGVFRIGSLDFFHAFYMNLQIDIFLCMCDPLKNNQFTKTMHDTMSKLLVFFFSKIDISMYHIPST